MLTVETIGRIRREHFLKGKTIKEIARDLKVSRNKVRRVLRSGATSFEYEREIQPRPKLGRWPLQPCARSLPIISVDIPSRDQQAPEALAALQNAEIEKWWPIIKTANIKGE